MLRLRYVSPKLLRRSQHLSRTNKHTIMFNLTMISWDILFSKYMYYLNFVKKVLFIYCNIINSYNLKQPCRQHRQYLLSNNSQLTESQIFQLQDEQFATWFRTHVSTHYLLQSYCISLQNSCLLFIVVHDIQDLSNGKEWCYFIDFTKLGPWKKS